MVFLSRRAALLSIAGAGMSLASKVLAARQEHAPAAFDQIQVREIIGARYDPELNTFALLADLGRPGDATGRFAVDDVIHLTRIGLAGIRSWAFSLEFDRKATDSFRREEIRQAWAFVDRLQRADHPAAKYLARLLPTGVLAEATRAQPASPAPGRVLLDLVDALNQARRDPYLPSPHQLGQESLGEGLLAGTIRPADEIARRNRIWLEDTFPEFLARDLGPRYVIRYLTEEKASVVQHELSGSRAEKLLVDADTFLKRAAYAIDLPGDLALGASQLTLCQIALEEQLARGDSPATDLGGPFVL